MGYAFDERSFEVFAGDLAPVTPNEPQCIDTCRDEVDDALPWSCLLSILKRFAVLLEFCLCGSVSFCSSEKSNWMNELPILWTKWETIVKRHRLHPDIMCRYDDPANKIFKTTFIERIAHRSGRLIAFKSQETSYLYQCLSVALQRYIVSLSKSISRSWGF